MRHLHDEFFGALLGAWVGVTQILGEDVIWSKICFFLIFLAVVAVFLDLTFAKGVLVSYRVFSGIILALAVVSFLYMFSFGPLSILNEQQVIFVGLLLGIWITFSAITGFIRLRVEEGF